VVKPMPSSDESGQGNQHDGATVTVVEETTGHRTYQVPVEDVNEDGVRLENAEIVDEAVHGDAIAYVRKDNHEEVNRLDK